MATLNLTQASKYLREKCHARFSGETLGFYCRGDLMPMLPAEKGADGKWYTTTDALEAWAIERRKTKATKQQLNVRVGGITRVHLSELCDFLGKNEGQVVEQALEHLFMDVVIADADRQLTIARAQDRE